MEFFSYVERSLENDISDKLEGEIIGFLKDEKSSAMIYLEKIEKKEKKLTKFKLHIIFWSMTDLDVTSEHFGKNEDSRRLSYPLIFRKADRKPIILNSEISIKNIKIELNCTSTALMISLGSGVYDYNILLRDAKKSGKIGSNEKKYVLMNLIGDPFQKKDIQVAKFHPENSYILTYVDNNSQQLQIFDVKRNLRFPIYSIKIDKAALKCESVIVDLNWPINKNFYDFSSMSLFLLTSSGSIFIVSVLLLPDMRLTRGTMQGLKERCSNLKKRDAKNGAVLHNFLKLLEKAVNIDHISGDFFLSGENARVLRGEIPDPIIKGPLRMNVGGVTKGKDQFYEKLCYFGFQNYHFFVLILNSGVLKLTFFMNPVYPVGIFDQFSAHLLKEYLDLDMINLTDLNILEAKSGDFMKSEVIKNLGKNFESKIQVKSNGPELLLKISSSLYRLNFKWVANTLESFRNFPGKNREKIFSNQIQENLKTNTCTLIHSSERVIEYFHEFHKKFHFIIFSEKGVLIPKFISTQKNSEEPKKVDFDKKMTFADSALLPLIAPNSETLNHKLGEVDLQQMIEHLKAPKSLFSDFAKKSVKTILADIRSYLTEQKEKNDKFLESTSEYLKVQTQKIKILNEINIDAELKNNAQFAKRKNLDQKMNRIRNKNEELKKKVVIILKKMDELAGNAEVSAGELELIKRVEDECSKVKNQISRNEFEVLLDKGEDSETNQMYERALKTLKLQNIKDIINKHNKIVEKLRILKKRTVLLTN